MARYLWTKLDDNTWVVRVPNGMVIHTSAHGAADALVLVPGPDDVINKWIEEHRA